MTDDQIDAPPIAHKWEPIEDLPENWRELCRPDLHDVHRQWLAERSLIKDEAKLKTFQEQLYTLWAVETGIIERLYTVDRGVTIQILEAGMESLGQIRDKGLITDSAETLIVDQRAALEMVMDLVGSQREPSPFYLKDLHQRLTLNQATRDVVDQFGNRRDKEWPTSEKGVWKQWPNNPLQPDGSIHEYCPPEQVESEIDQLLAWWKQHESLGVCAEVEAAWLHHRFAQIHPFIDGNGRLARALSSAVFLKEDYLVLVVRDEEHREPYLDALGAADKGDLKPLVDLFANIQRSDLQESIKTISSLRGEETVQAIEAAAAAARRTQDATTAGVATSLDKLMRVAQVRLEEVAAETQRAFESQGVVVSISVSGDGTSEAGWSTHLLEAMKNTGYRMNSDRPWRWTSLGLGLPARPEVDSRLAVSVSGSGSHPRQHMASAFLLRRSDEEWTSTDIATPPFFFEIAPPADEEFEEVAAKFRVWLEKQITNGIHRWTQDL